MKIKSSRNLYLFYQDMASAIQDEDSYWDLDCNVGLCANLSDYATENEASMDHDSLLIEMHNQFTAAGLDRELPFNADVAAYLRESFAHACFKNDQRIQWVFDRLADGVIGE